MPDTAELVFTVFLGLPLIGFFVWGLRNLVVDRDPLLLLCLLGGAVALAFEPIVDVLGLCYFPEEGSIHAFTVFGRALPLFMVLVYPWYVGGSAYLAYRLFQRGMAMKGVFLFWALEALQDVVVETPGIWMDAYTYYGDQPLDFWGFPLWWPIVNPLSAMIGGLLVLKTLPLLHGWRRLGVIALVPAGCGFANAACAWPVWLALNSDLGMVPKTAAALVTLSLSLFGVWLIGKAVATTPDRPVRAPRPQPVPAHEPALGLA